MSELRQRVGTYNWGATASNLEERWRRRGEERIGEERIGEERREERIGKERREERKGGKRGKEEKGEVGTKEQLQHKTQHLMELFTFISPEVYCDID